ncbi:MAG TPA: hypothetical protein VKD04_10700 [Burkholderiales bacterium]|nr:hypothetical protein [Burkholderiales bacterium]
MLPRCLALLLLVATLQASAVSEAQTPAGGILDCEHPPGDLTPTLPKQLAGAATVICTPSAQMIVAAQGWSWRFPGSFFDRPSIPAYSPMASRPEAGGRYFTGFKATELSGGEIRKLHEAFAKTLATYTDKSPPARIVKLVARNDQGHPMDAYFGFKSRSEGWVAVCTPDCAPDFFFLINRHD